MIHRYYGSIILTKIYNKYLINEIKLKGGPRKYGPYVFEKYDNIVYDNGSKAGINFMTMYVVMK